MTKPRCFTYFFSIVTTQVCNNFVKVVISNAINVLQKSHSAIKLTSLEACKDTLMRLPYLPTQMTLAH